MIVKFLFVVLVFVFGAAMFGAGVQAPPAVREPVTRQLQRVVGALHSKLVSAEQWASDTVELKPQTTAVSEYRELLLTSRSEAPGAYSVQVGLYSDRAAADRQLEQLKTAGYKSHVVAVGQLGQPASYVLAVGPLSSLSQARNELRALRLTVSATSPLIVIRFPSGKGKAKAPAKPSSPAVPAP